MIFHCEEGTLKEGEEPITLNTENNMSLFEATYDAKTNNFNSLSKLLRGIELPENASKEET